MIFIVLITHVICFAECKFASLALQTNLNHNTAIDNQRITQKLSSNLNKFVFQFLVLYYNCKIILKSIIIIKDLQDFENI